MNTDVVGLQNSNALTGQPKASTGKDLGKDQFLQLLMTQLQNQDPMNPTDSTQFVAQLSQFANLEQMTNIDTKMDSLISATTAGNSSGAVSLLGKDVRVAGNAISGPSSVFYNLSAPVKALQIDIRDDKNQVVKSYTKELSLDAGLHELKVDVPAGGNYKVYATGMDLNNQLMSPDLSISDRVRGVNFSADGPVLLMESGNQMKASDVVEIRQPDPVPVTPVAGN